MKEFFKILQEIQKGGFHGYSKLFWQGILADIFLRGVNPDRNAIRRALNLDPIISDDPIYVSVYQAWRRGIEGGRFQSTGGVTEKRFPIKNDDTVRSFVAKLFRFGGDTPLRNAIQHIKTADRKRPWQLAKIEHLLDYGTSHYDRKFRCRVVALGSPTWLNNEGEFVPMVSWDEWGHHLSLTRPAPFGYNIGNFHVLAVRERRRDE